MDIEKIILSLYTALVLRTWCAHNVCKTQIDNFENEFANELCATLSLLELRH